MINFRSMLSSVFKINNEPKETTQFKMLNSYDNYFSPFTGDIYNDSTVRTCIDIIARNCAKLKPAHIRRIEGRVVKHQDTLDTILSQRPNEFMSTYDFIYKTVSQLLLNNNAFIYIQTDNNGNIRGLYPLDFAQVELREDSNNNMYCRFSFMQKQITMPYGDLIHLRRNFANHDIFGASNDIALKKPVNILLTLKQSLESAVKNCTKIRGYLQVNGTMTPEDQQANRNDFINLIDKKSGIAVVDSKMSYNPINTELKMADNEQLEFARQDIYRYFGLSEKIINATYNEAEWIAFYESVIEPIAIQMGQEFTAKLFTEREKGFGNEVIFATNRLEYADLKSKVQMVQVLQQTGIFSVNEFREVFGFDPVPDGDKMLVKADYSQGTTASPTAPVASVEALGAQDKGIYMGEV